jgi:MFS family permease
VAIAGLILDRIDFPLNYQIVFVGLSLGGLVSYAYSSRIELPDAVPQTEPPGLSLQQRLRSYFSQVWSEKPFVAFTAKRFVYLSAAALGTPLFPLYFVREVHASDAWIGAINTAQTFILLFGYQFWSRQWRVRGARFVLLWTTLGLALYPTLTALTHRVELIVVYAALAGIFQAGLDLVFFDELMKTVPPQHSATFVSLAQSIQYLSTIASPLVGTFLADHIGIGGGLLVSAALRVIGFALFARSK